MCRYSTGDLALGDLSFLVIVIWSNGIRRFGLWRYMAFGDVVFGVVAFGDKAYGDISFGQM